LQAAEQLVDGGGVEREAVVCLVGEDVEAGPDAAQLVAGVRASAANAASRRSSSARVSASSGTPPGRARSGQVPPGLAEGVVAARQAVEAAVGAQAGRDRAEKVGRPARRCRG
jgi:hypothetical protein